jgi:hypothetical protein
VGLAEVESAVEAAMAAAAAAGGGEDRLLGREGRSKEEASVAGDHRLADEPRGYIMSVSYAQ